MGLQKQNPANLLEPIFGYVTSNSRSFISQPLRFSRKIASIPRPDPRQRGIRSNATAKVSETGEMEATKEHKGRPCAAY